MSSCNEASPETGAAMREAIRATWGSTAIADGGGLRFFFGLPAGKGAESTCAKALAAEDRQHQDLVVLPLEDSYGNLTRKTLAIMSWVSEPARVAPPAWWLLEVAADKHAAMDATMDATMDRDDEDGGSRRGRRRGGQQRRAARDAAAANASFIAKVDDDVYVDTEALRDRLQALSSSPSFDAGGGPIYLGSFLRDSAVITDPRNKWYDPTYHMERYPPYAAGPFYVLSAGLAHWLAANRDQLRTDWRNEDASMGTWLMGTSARRVDDPGIFTFWQYEASNRFSLPFVRLGRTFGPLAVHVQPVRLSHGTRAVRTAQQSGSKADALRKVHASMEEKGLTHLHCCADIWPDQVPLGTRPWLAGTLEDAYYGIRWGADKFFYPIFAPVHSILGI
eukprot:g17.t1